MPHPSFHERRDHRPQADCVATLLAQSPGGISRKRLAAAELPPDRLDDLLKALTATGQVVMLRVNGELTFWAAG